jgi:threo-3-hydroxy-L-aspartate ammonia-lyase
LGASAALQKKVDMRGKKVGVILSGGNVDPIRFAQLLMSV